jgi:membrane protease YdiL (CAAX protease family)
MENNFVIAKSGHELGVDCKRATSRLHFSVLVYILVTSLAVSLASFGLGIFSIIAPGIYATIMSTPLYQSILSWTLQVLCMYVIGYPVFYFMTRHLEKRDLSGGEKLSFLNFIMLALASTGTMFIGSIIATNVSDIITGVLGIPAENTTSDFISDTNIWIVILVVVIIGPIFEELIFRKAFVDVIGKHNIGLAIFISGASFALFHGNIHQTIYTFVGGLLFAWTYAKTKKIIYPILLHMFINFVGTVPSILVADSVDRVLGMTDEELMAATDPQILADIMKVNAYVYMEIGIMVVGAIILIYMLCTGFFKLDRSGETKIPFFKKLGILIFNLGAIVFVAYSIISIILMLFMPLIEQYLGTV